MSQITKLGSTTAGTVTSIAAGTGITATPDPITATGTIALSTPVSIAHGGTNATSYTQSNGIVTYNGTSLVNYPGPQLSSSGVYTNSSQPAFHVYASSSLANATGDGTLVRVPYNTIVFDNTSSFIPGTNVFVAPVSGRYMMGYSVQLTNITVATSALAMALFTDSGSYTVALNPYNFTPAGVANFLQGYSMFINLAAGDNCYVELQVYNSTKTVSISAGAPNTFFWGYLVC